MAVTSIWPIKGRVDDVIRYAANPEKTTEKRAGEIAALHAVDDVIEYAADEMKTEKLMFATGINCNLENAIKRFKEDLSRRGEKDERVCYHGYQSFAENEVDAYTAHEIGKKLAERLWGDKYRVVVATHCNTGHYHNHFVICSQPMVKGPKFRNSHEDYRRMREESDRLCREYGLSVVELPRDKGKNYGEWLAEKEGRPTLRSVIREAIDVAIKGSVSQQQFLAAMDEMGFIIVDKSSELSSRMKRGLIRAKDNFKNLADDGQVTPEEYAEDKIKYASEDVAGEIAHDSKETVKKTYDGSKRLVQQIKQKRQSGDTIKQTNKSTGKQTFKTMKKNIKTAGSSTGKTVKTSEATARTTVKTTQKAAKTAEQTAKAAKKAAEASAKAAKRSAEAAKAAAKAAAQTAKVAAKAVVAAAKAIASGVKALVAAIAAGGWVAVVAIIVILLIVIVAMIVGSGFGIFYSMEDSGSGMTMLYSSNGKERIYCSHSTSVGKHTNCKKEYYDAKLIEAYVFYYLKQQINIILELSAKVKERRADGKMLYDTEVQKIRQQIKTMDEERIRLYEQYANGHISKEKYISGKEKLNSEKNKKQEHLDRIEEERRAENDFLFETERMSNRIASISPGRRITREIADAYIDEVIINGKDDIAIKFRFEDVVSEYLNRFLAKDA